MPHPQPPRRRLGLRNRLVLILLAGLGAYVLVITGCQRAIIFPRHVLPDVSGEQPPPGVERLSRQIDGGEVEAWLMLAPGSIEGGEAKGEGRLSSDDTHANDRPSPLGSRPSPLVIFAHGNGELIDYWPPALEPYTQRGVSVLMVEYRGYGRSAGSPSQDAIVDDFVYFYDLVTKRDDIDASRIVLHGRSLGGGVIAQLAAKRRPAGMILESCFTSLADVARGHLVPRFLVRDPMEVRGVIREVNYPILILHGGDDATIPPHHARSNHEAASTSRLVMFDDVGHNDLFPAEDYWREIDQLLTDAGALDASTPPPPEKATTMLSTEQIEPTRSTPMSERTGVVTLKGNPMTLIGPELKVGDKAPDFKLKAQDMSDKSLADYHGKTKIVSVVPSLDTSVCDTETRKFNEKAAGLGSDIVILTVSVDTPMAQKRWCAAAGIDKVVTLSDFKDQQFGKDYGVRMKENGLLARTVFVIDKGDKFTYVQRVPEIAQEPDYDKVIDAAKKAK